MRKDIFKEKLYNEFQQDLYRVLNATIDDYLCLHTSRGEDPITRFDKLYVEKGQLQFEVRCKVVSYS